MNETGLRYVGVLTDGVLWNCYYFVNGALKPVSPLNLAESDTNGLLVWLEGVLATTRDIAPTAANIEQRLGASSSAYKLDRATLADLYERIRQDPTVEVKRALWAKLLTSALGNQFKNDDDLFIDHTLLVNTSEIIAHALLGLPVEMLPPSVLLSGEKFTEAGVYGVVESDFFSWVIENASGKTFIKTLAKRLMRFAWSDVDQDILKILYETFIGSETRKRLGEYYTPDWLAEAVISETVKEPLATRVLDAACGSGTFLFYAVRRYIHAAEAEGRDTEKILNDVTRHVVGMDLHPVAVTLARVTYLLAIGRARLTDPNRGNIQIPVYLGDSIQWREQNLDLWSAGHLVINTDEQRTLFGSELSFPDALLEDTVNFDRLVNGLADRASKRKPDSPVPSLKSLFSRLAIPEEHRAVIDATFRTMCHLHDVGRDHIWGYYIRNLARPLWLSRPGNQVDMVVGNPPWLAYSHMTPEMQVSFRSMSERRGLWAGAKLSPHQDLSALFVVRACELYLRKGGQFALVLPNAALDRQHYAGFRTGTYSGDSGVLTLSFSASWDLRRIRPHFFPRASSVVFGSRIDNSKRGDVEDQTPMAQGMPEETEIWTGRLESANARWDNAKLWLKRVPGKVRHLGQFEKSPYAPRFTQGATFVPRLAFVVNKTTASPLGLSQGNTAVESQRTVLEKKPWKNLPSISGVVESQFIRPFFTGDNVYPFTIGKPMLAVVPCDDASLMDSDRLDLYPGLQQWWSRANQLWDDNRASKRLTLLERLDYQATLSKQLPIPALRVVYNRSGMHVCAAKLHNRRALVNSGLYWASAASEAEADYICGIINAPITTDLTRPMMSYGKDERDIHKHIWELPIPEFDSANDVRKQISSLGAALEKKIADDFTPDEAVYFAATRRHIRDFMMDSAEGLELNELVLDLIS